MSALVWHNKDDPAGSDPLLVLAHLPDPALKKGKPWSSRIQPFEFPGSCLAASLFQRSSQSLYSQGLCQMKYPPSKVMQCYGNGQRIPKPYTTQAPGLAWHPIIHPACTECLFPVEGGRGHFFADLVLPGRPK